MNSECSESPTVEHNNRVANVMLDRVALRLVEFILFSAIASRATGLWLLAPPLALAMGWRTAPTLTRPWGGLPAVAAEGEGTSRWLVGVGGGSVHSTHLNERRH